MHALHSLAHRAPPATRTRVRWQPYNAIPSTSYSSISSRSPPAQYLNTPKSVTSSPPHPTPANEIDRIRHTLPSATPQVLKEVPSRDTCRNKYAIGLVDQAVKSLCEIWRPQDIPAVFISPSRELATVGAAYEPTSLVVDPKPAFQRKLNRNTQLPSPVSPSTQASPSSTSSNSSPSISVQTLTSPEHDIASTPGSRSNLVPIRGFVHEVLRRSRTSGCVLQTALCYLEALRLKVPQLVLQEESGEGLMSEPETSDRITLATEAELAHEAELSMSLDAACEDQDLMDTVRICDGADSAPMLTETGMTLQQQVAKKTAANAALPPAPRLPSPLLCPRRAFLASLILASKFTQDKCYSNRAWAKLSGLPPREIGRCERALGEALEWRLWVGKRPVAPATASPPVVPLVSRPVVRSQSESSLLTPTSSKTPFLSRSDKSDLLVASTTMLSNGGLRRCVTLPAEAYAAAATVPLTSDQVPWRVSVPDHLYLSAQDNDMQTTEDLTPTDVSKPMDVTPSTSAFLTYAEKLSQSPSPETPGLSYSPTSTESSSGDRTIQMSTFLEDTMAPFCTNINPGNGHSDQWAVWLETSEMNSYMTKTPIPPFSHPVQPNPILEHFGAAPSMIGCGVSSQTKGLHFTGSDSLGCPWVTENSMTMHQLRV